MEQKLKKLFDYQRFEKNEKLEKLIRETESRYAKELSDDDLALVNAAGDGQENIGGLVGTAKGGTVNNCYNTGDSIGNYPKEQ